MTAPDDLAIARAARLAPIADVARQRLGLAPHQLVPYGHDVAKIPLPVLSALPPRPDARLVLVTAISPTPAGEGKTTTTIGLADALQRIGQPAVVALRQPSMGPVFGLKGGATGGGRAQVAPMASINLHFTGDFHAVGAAHNLLAAALDNHLHHGNALDLDPRRIAWKRVLDVNDRALRRTVVGLGGATHGVPREDGFDIVVASEVMAILCLADSLADLRRRLGRIVVARTRSGRAVRAEELKVAGAMAVLLKDALAPNLVQTLEGTPALVHGGPFANIAHGCNSLMATRAALRLAPVVVTEAGFGADLGAEKFVDIVCRTGGLQPAAAVLVATARALKYHGGVALADLGREDLPAIDRGMANLARHLDNLRDVFGLPCVVAVNAFAADTAAEHARVLERCGALGAPAVVARHWAEGGAGAVALAHEVLRLAPAGAEPPPLRCAYPLELPLWDKLERLAQRIYGAAGIDGDAAVRAQARRLQDEGHGALPVCVAKTPMSFATDAALRGAPTGHRITVRELWPAAGAGFVVARCGDVLTMPGLPAVPAAERIDLDDDGEIVGLH